MNLKQPEWWRVTGSQHLYGEETLNKAGGISGTVPKSLLAGGAHPSCFSQNLIEQLEDFTLRRI